VIQLAKIVIWSSSDTTSVSVTQLKLSHEKVHSHSSTINLQTRAENFYLCPQNNPNMSERTNDMNVHCELKKKKARNVLHINITI
jgi:hypothetical protein